MEELLNNVVVQYIIGGVVMLVFFVILGWAGMRAAKKGKVDKHWRDY